MVGYPVAQCDHVHDLGHEFNQYIVLMLKKNIILIFLKSTHVFIGYPGCPLVLQN
jgi:hypothetical protein